MVLVPNVHSGTWKNLSDPINDIFVGIGQREVHSKELAMLIVAEVGVDAPLPVE